MKTFSNFTQASFLNAALLLLFLSPCRGASPLADLYSPSQAVRDAAAKFLRETYKPPARTNWNPLIEMLKPGMPKLSVLELLKSRIVSSENGGGAGETESELYRLDDLWVLQCFYRHHETSKSLLKYELREQLRSVTAKIPDGYSGRWTYYYVNGQKSGESRLQDGKVSGECISFYPDGSKWVVNQVINGMLQGDETLFFPSGKVLHKGAYKDGAQAGIWTWYKEDGTVESTLDFDKLTKGQ